MTENNNELHFGVYKRLTTLRQEQKFLENHPSKIPLSKLTTRDRDFKVQSRTTWYGEENIEENRQILSEKEETIKQDFDDLQIGNNSKQSPLKSAKSEPNLLAAIKAISTDNIFAPSEQVKLRDRKNKNKTLQQRNNKALSVYEKSCQAPNKKSRPRSANFLTSAIMRSRNSISNAANTLLETLESKKLRAAFNDFLGSEFSSENLYFWTACEKFRKLKNAEQRLRDGRWIYSRFISPNAQHQINIDYITRRQITLTFTSGESIPSDIFDNAQKYVFSIMENDSFPRFLSSNYYRDACAKKNAFESVFGSILPGNKNSTSPSKSPNKLKSNSNSNNNNNNTVNSSYDDSSPPKNSVSRRFSFGFKKTHSTKLDRSNGVPDMDSNMFIPLQVKVA